MGGTVVQRRLWAAVLSLVLLLMMAVAPAGAAPPVDNPNVPPDVGRPTDPGAPSVPTGLAAEPLHEAVRLTWTPTADRRVETLQIQRDGVEVAQLLATDTTWLDSGLESGRLYRYTMTATDGRGRVSAVSAPVDATPLDLVAPAAPAAPAATPGDTQATISWAPVVDAGLAGYRLYQDGVFVLDVPAGTTTVTVTGLTNDQEYRYAVSAFDTSGNESAVSPDVAVTPRDRTPPAVPLGLNAQAGDGQATLTWDAVSDPALAGYRLYQDGVLIREVDATTLSAVVEGLVNDVEVVYTVSAVDAAGNESEQSPPVAVIPRDTTPPAVPLNLIGEAGDTEAILTWDTVAADDLAGYRLYQDGVAVLDIAAGTTTATVTGLTNAREYRFTVAAFDLAGNESAPSAGALVTPVDRTPPPVPSGLVGTAGDSEATLSWVAVDAPDLARYRVYLDDELVATVPAGTEVATITGLVNGRTYLLSVAAEDATGNRSDRSPAVSVQPRDLTPPPVPTGLTAVPGDHRVSLSWDAVTDDSLAGYRLYFDGVLTREVPSGTTIDVADLVNGQQYSVTVTAFDAAGNESAASAPVVFVPVDNEPPPAPTNLRAWNGGGFVSLRWDASTGADVAGYRIYRDGVLLADVPASQLRYRDTTIAPGATHLYAVSAIDEVPNESPLAGPVEPADPMVVTDDFDRADGHIGVTPGSLLPWLDLAGNPAGWLVASNQAAAKSSGTVSMAMYATVDPGIADGTVAATIENVRSDTSRTGLVFRATDLDNQWRVDRFYAETLDCGPGVALIRRVAGLERIVARHCDPSVGPGSRLMVSMSGSTIKVLLDGTEVLEVIDTFNADATRHGMRGATGDILDDFAIASPANDIAPTVPTGLSVVNGDGQVDVSWNAVGDTDVETYRVYRDGVVVDEVDANTTAATVTGLIAGTTYEITVTAVDVFGNESPHAVMVPTTPGAQVVFDDFNRPDGAVGKAPVSGRPWLDLDGNPASWLTQSNRAAAKSNGTVTAAMYATVDSGISDGTVEASVHSWFSDTSRVGLVFRATDLDNQWRVDRFYSQTLGCGPGVALIRRVAGLERIVARHCSPDFVAGSHVMVSMSGSTIKVLLDGTQVLETIDTFNVDATRHGMRGATGDILDDFQISSGN